MQVIISLVPGMQLELMAAQLTSVEKLGLSTFAFTARATQPEAISYLSAARRAFSPLSVSRTLNFASGRMARNTIQVVMASAGDPGAEGEQII